MEVFVIAFIIATPLIAILVSFWKKRDKLANSVSKPLNEQQHCHVCGIPLSGDFKYSGSVFMCNRCYKVRFITRILLIIAGIIAHFLVSLLFYAIGLLLRFSALYYPSLIVFLAIALILTNPISAWYIKKHPNKHTDIPTAIHRKTKKTTVNDTDNNSNYERDSNLAYLIEHQLPVYPFIVDKSSINTIKTECDREQLIISEKKEKLLNYYSKAFRKAYLIGSVIAFVLIILFSFSFAELIYKNDFTYERDVLTNGEDVVCYVTDHGKFYHKYNCFYLHSKNETTMYEAELSGYMPCSYCWSYPVAKYKRATFVNWNQTILFSFLTAAGIVLIPFGAFLIFTYIRFKRKNKVAAFVFLEHSIKIFNKYLLRMGDEKTFLEKAREFCGVPDDVQYDNNLPNDKNNSFLAYCSYNGHCYHYFKKCHGHNLRPIHRFIAVKCLSPCYYCVSKPIAIPQWHTDYIQLCKIYYGVKESKKEAEQKLSRIDISNCNKLYYEISATIKL